MSKLVGAVVQVGTPLYDTPKTIQKLADWTAKARAESADLVVFPEAFVGGYPKGIDFGVRLGSRSDEGRDVFRRYYESAIDVPGAEIEAIGEIAAKNNVNLVVGVIERDGGTLYCTALYFSRDGSLLGKHRKLMPTALERVVWGGVVTGQHSLHQSPILVRWVVPFAGKTICHSSGLPCIKRVWSFTVHQRLMTVMSGCPPCKQLLLKDVVLCSQLVSS